MKNGKINLTLQIGLLMNALFLISRQLDFIPHFVSLCLATIGISCCIIGSFSSDAFKNRRKAKLAWIKKILHINENSL